MKQIKNKRITVEIGNHSNPFSTHIIGIGDAWVNLNNSRVKYFIDNVSFDPISFFKNEDWVIFMLNCIAKKKHGLVLADIFISGQLENPEGNQLILFAEEISFNCTMDQFLKGFDNLFRI